MSSLESCEGIRLSDPLSYNEFMSLVCDAKLAITDSGGIQEETTYLNIPCLTLRLNTERPITVSQGTNRLIKPHTLAAAIDDVLQGSMKLATRPDLWDGKTAARVARSLHNRCNALETM